MSNSLILTVFFAYGRPSIYLLPPNFFTQKLKSRVFVQALLNSIGSAIPTYASPRTVKVGTRVVLVWRAPLKKFRWIAPCIIARLILDTCAIFHLLFDTFVLELTELAARTFGALNICLLLFAQLHIVALFDRTLECFLACAHGDCRCLLVSRHCP